MKTLESLVKEEAKLRVLHTDQTTEGLWQSADTTRQKLVANLDAQAALKSAPMITIPPPTPVTAFDEMLRAKACLERVIANLDGGRVGNSVTWAASHEALGHINDAIARLK